MTAPEPFSPRTRALEALIVASLDALAQGESPSRPSNEALLFVGNWNDALPRLLIHDQVLEPVDKIVWAVIKTCADPRRGTAFPNYLTIARLANVGAEGTVARALAILRLTRWLTLCGRARDLRGRFRGNVYVLHDEPLPLSDTLHLDPTYMDLAYQARSHHHGRVARVASSVVSSFELDQAEGARLEKRADTVSARIEAQQLITRVAEGPPIGPPAHPESTATFRYFSVRADLLPAPAKNSLATEARRSAEIAPRQESDPPECPPQEGNQHRLQNLKTAEPQNLTPQNLRSPRSSSSSSKRNTTTTDSEASASKFDAAAPATSTGIPKRPEPLADPVDVLGSLRWPDWLSPNYRRLSALELRSAPDALRQTLLDLLDQRQRDGEASIAERLRSPVQYLRSLCQRAAAGKLVLPANSEPSPSAVAVDDPAAAANARLAELKQRLRLAQGDYQHWQRLVDASRDETQKARVQAWANEAQAEIGRIRAEIDSWKSPT